MPREPIRVGIIGVGKFARDRHIPSIRANPDFQLVAACSRHAQVEGVRNFTSINGMLTQAKDLDAVSICTPPQIHYEMAKFALVHGKHVLLEKPPCTSQSQLAHLVDLAGAHGVSLYQIWHSQHAPGVSPALGILQQRTLRGARVTWKEDVRIWHPGQTWIWQPGGFGVFDAGINALSILTRLIGEPIFPLSSVLYLPSNCETPIAASVVLQIASGPEIQVEFDFRHTGIQSWDIDFDTDEGPVKLSAGGSHLTVGDPPLPHDPENLHGEYVSVYEHFAQLVGERRSEVDARPLQLVADILLLGRRVSVAPFFESTP
jgi:predicted dehydrogenase